MRNAPKEDSQPALEWLFWAGVWLALGLVAIKASYLGAPTGDAQQTGQVYLRALAAISYADVVFVVTAWAVARALVALVGRWRVARSTVVTMYTLVGAVVCLYGVASVVMFGAWGGFLTYPLLALVGDVRMLRSSVAAFLTPKVAASVVCLPLSYVTLVWGSTRTRSAFIRRRGRASVAGAFAIAWIFIGAHAYASRWTTRSDRAIADNPEWVFASSWWQTMSGGDAVRMGGLVSAADLTDFVGLGPQTRRRARAGAAERPPLNVIVLVLESVAARWTSLNSRVYVDTTPSLTAAAAHGIAFDNFYAHIGRSSNSLVSILLSHYPKLDFRDITDEYPTLSGTSLATLFEDRGYRTAFITPSDLSWAGWTTFLQGRGFGEISDYHQLACADRLSSWGVEDRCMFDGIISFVNREPTRPFFVLGWTQQTHHPYEPTPGVPLLGLVREPVPDEYDLNRYLNVLHETDRHVGRLVDAISRAGLDQHTLIVIVGDHGQAFGYPHEGNYMQGRTVYEEDVHVPLLLWDPRRYRSGVRSKTIGGHVDLAPTIAEMAGLTVAADWQGRSLVEPGHFPRSYFYVAEDHFRLGVREERWKYIYDLRAAVDELYDLDRDPDEQHNVAASEPRVSARLRQRLAAWAEANRRQYENVPSAK